MSLENIFVDVKRGKQIKRDELALGGLVLDLWRQLGAKCRAERKQGCQSCEDILIVRAAHKLLQLKDATIRLVRGGSVVLYKPARLNNEEPHFP